MDVEMGNRLPCRKPVVDTDIEAVGPMLRRNQSMGPVQQHEQFALFFGRGLEERTDVASGDDQGVSGRNRELVSDDQGEVRFEENEILWDVTERTMSAHSPCSLGPLPAH